MRQAYAPGNAVMRNDPALPFLDALAYAEPLLAYMPYLLGALAFAGVLVFGLPRGGRRRPRRYGRRQKAFDAAFPVDASGRPVSIGGEPYRSRPPTASGAGSGRPDPNEQIRHVLKADYRTRKVMNRSEYAVFAETRRLLERLGGGHHVFPQVPLGQILQTPCSEASRAVNAKRLDLLIVDAVGLPATAIEYHGGGHFQGDAIQRDRIKKVALERAGIPLIELYEDWSPDALAESLRSALGSASAPAPAEAPGDPVRSHQRRRQSMGHGAALPRPGPGRRRCRPCRGRRRRGRVCLGQCRGRLRRAGRRL